MKKSFLKHIFFVCLVFSCLTIFGPQIYASTSMKCVSIFAENHSLQIDTSLVDFPKSEFQAHYENSALQIREVVEKTGLNFPNIPVEVIIHPFFNHPAARASLNARFDRIIITVPYQWMIEKKLRGKFVVIPNTPIRTLGAFYHEFGHAIFRFNSEKSESSLLSEYYQIKRKFVNLTTRIIELRSRLNKKNYQLIK